MNGWVSPALPKLISENTPLTSGPLTNTQVSWVGSINAIGAMCGTTSSGFLIRFFGSKRTMLFLAMPSVLFWTLIYIGDSFTYVLIARFFVGYGGGGIQNTVIMYISDIADPR